MKSIETSIEKLEEAIRQINIEPEPFPVIDPTGLSKDEISAEAERRHLRCFASDTRLQANPVSKWNISVKGREGCPRLRSNADSRVMDCFLSGTTV